MKLQENLYEFRVFHSISNQFVCKENVKFIKQIANFPGMTAGKNILIYYGLGDSNKILDHPSQ